MLPVFSREAVAKHDSPTDAWIIINGGVYDATNYLSKHPGGKDATKDFQGMFHSRKAQEILKTLKVGTLQGEIENQLQVPGRGGRTIVPGIIEYTDSSDETDSTDTDSSDESSSDIESFLQNAVKRMNVSSTK